MLYLSHVDHILEVFHISEKETGTHKCMLLPVAKWRGKVRVTVIYFMKFQDHFSLAGI